jgi:hypothetical protein
MSPTKTAPTKRNRNPAQPRDAQPPDAKRAAAQAAPPQPIDEDDDEGPEDIDQFRLDLARRMNNISRAWRDCAERACRRSKRCVGPDLRCLRDCPPRTQEETARIQADMRYWLNRRLAELERNGLAEVETKK